MFDWRRFSAPSKNGGGGITDNSYRAITEMVIATPNWPSAIHMETPTVWSQVGPTLYVGFAKHSQGEETSGTGERHVAGSTIGR